MALYGGDGEVARLPARMKRKDLEEAYHDFSEFSLSSPARKSRRLDAELAPIMREGEPAPHHIFGQPGPEVQLQSSSQGLVDALDEVVPSPSLNEERAIVLYKPVYSPLLDFPSSVVFQVDPRVIAGLKNGGLWSGQSDMVETEEGETPTDDGKAASNSCLAMVPWVPSQPSGVAIPARVPAGTSELAEQAMVCEDAESASMDVEEEGGQPSCAAVPGMVATEGFQHWQQHCMAPRINPSTPTPIMWSWG